MANPQSEAFTKFPNGLLEAICRTNLSAYENRVFFFILRKTSGFHKESDWISHSQFEAGLDLDRRLVGRALKKLEERGMILVDRADKKRLIYAIQEDHTKWKSSSKKMTKPKEVVISVDDEVSSGKITESAEDIISMDDDISSKKMMKSSSPEMTYKRNTDKRNTTKEKNVFTAAQTTGDDDSTRARENHGDTRTITEATTLTPFSPGGFGAGAPVLRKESVDSKKVETVAAEDLPDEYSGARDLTGEDPTAEDSVASAPPAAPATHALTTK